jgi:hypothetical protein
MKLVYSNHEKLEKEIERRRVEKKFDALSDHLVPEEERSYNRKYKNMEVVGGKFYDSTIKKIYEKISGLAKD